VPLLLWDIDGTLLLKASREHAEAIHAAIERMMRAQRRILLTLATGTGKTFIAFQIVWKLRKSGWLRKPVLFLCDRIPLRGQAFNTFGPFATVGADPRDVIETGAFKLVLRGLRGLVWRRRLVFSAYVSLHLAGAR